jgi:hypothetical protein
MLPGPADTEQRSHFQIGDPSRPHLRSTLYRLLGGHQLAEALDGVRTNLDRIVQAARRRTRG